MLNMRQLISAVGLAIAATPAWAIEAIGDRQYANPLWVWICAGAAIVVFGAITYSVATYRPTPADASTPQRRPARELVWASVPIVIVIAAAMPSLTHTAARDQLAANRTAHPDLCIEASKPLRPSPGSAADMGKASASSCTAQQ